MGRNSWELTDDQKKEINENSEKIIADWHEKQKSKPENTDAADDEEIGAREKTRDDDIR